MKVVVACLVATLSVPATAIDYRTIQGNGHGCKEGRSVLVMNANDGIQVCANAVSRIQLQNPGLCSSVFYTFHGQTSQGCVCVRKGEVCQDVDGSYGGVYETVYPMCSNVTGGASSTYPCKCGGTLCHGQQSCTATTSTDGVCAAIRLPSIDITYTYDFTDDGTPGPGVKGAGTLKDVDGKQGGPYSLCVGGPGICAGEQVFFRGSPGQSWGYTLSCQRVMTGVHGQLALRAVYTDASSDKYPGPVVKDSGCSTWRFGPHSTFSCCLPASATNTAEVVV